MLLNDPSPLKVAGRRSGFTLIEVFVAMVLTAIFATVASRHFRIEGESAVRTDNAAHEIRLLLRSSRQNAIRDGRIHGLRFVRRRGKYSWIERYRRDINGRRQVIGNRVPVDEVVVSVLPDDPTFEFDSEGTASGGSRITIDAASRRWRIDVMALTGVVRVIEF